MTSKIKGIFFLICAVVVAWMALILSEEAPARINISRITPQMVEEYQDLLDSKETKRQNATAARARAENENRMYRCEEDDECVIVDRDPCGCLKGPSGVTAINSEWSLEFSKFMEKQFSGATACPSTAVTEQECSEQARAVCRSNRCTIVY